MRLLTITLKRIDAAIANYVLYRIIFSVNSTGLHGNQVKLSRVISNSLSQLKQSIENDLVNWSVKKLVQFNLLMPFGTMCIFPLNSFLQHV
jgi:hypothetical protein